MKKRDATLISRGLDADLDPSERERLEALLQADSEAAGTQRAWERLGDSLRVRSAEAPAPDPALAWQDIRRAIRLAEDDASPIAPPVSRLRWAHALASLAIVGLFGLSAWQLWRTENRPVTYPAYSRVEWVIPEVPGATTMIYTDEETDMTVIWMDVAQSPDPRDT